MTMPTRPNITGIVTGLVAAVIACAVFCYKPPRAPNAGHSGIHFQFVSRPTLLAPAAFTVKLPDTTGKPLAERVSIEFIMPAMAMPKNVTTPIQTKPGVYSGTTTLTMSGDWIAIARIMTSSGKPVKQHRFPFNVP
jgi:hypothetical protein